MQKDHTHAYSTKPTNIVRRLQGLVKVSVSGNQFGHGLYVERIKNSNDPLEPPGLYPAFPW